MVLAYTRAAAFDALILPFLVRADRTAITVHARRPDSPVLAYTRAAAFDALRLLFPVLAERTALAFLAVRPLSLVLAYTRAAANDAFIRPSPVLAFLANPGHGVQSRAQLGPSSRAVIFLFIKTE